MTEGITTATVLRSEWTKITTLRATWLVPVIGTALSVSVSALTCAIIGDKQELLIGDPSVALYYGLLFAQLAYAGFGIMLLGQEFNSGTISSSLATVPRRGLLYGAKLAMGAGIGLALGLANAVGSFTAGVSLDGTAVGWGDPGALRSVVAAALYPPLLIMFCLGVTAMLGNLTAAMGLVLPGLVLGTSALALIPGVRTLALYLPDKAGQYAMRFAEAPDAAYDHWVGTLVLALWAGAAGYGGCCRFGRYES